MTRPAYYNEFDPFAAAWLRNLITAGHIAPGDVDERSIVDVTPDDLAGYGQCHFFAGIGGWSLAFRIAGIPDAYPAWSGSAPCQGFSATGRRAGFADDRHLWPHFSWLIQQRQPPIVVGEQVASADADPWVDLVQHDVEAMDYAFGCVAGPSAGFGAPHIRDRNFWVAYANSIACGEGRAILRGRAAGGDALAWAGSGRDGMPVWLGDTDHARSQGYAGHDGAARWEGSNRPAAEAGLSGGLAHADGDGCGEAWERDGQAQLHRLVGNDGVPAGAPAAGPVNGFWGNADWLHCRDGKWRPVEPGTCPLAHGVPTRVGRLRGYGNAINPWQGAEVITALLECMP